MTAWPTLDNPPPVNTMSKLRHLGPKSGRMDRSHLGRPDRVERDGVQTGAHHAGAWVSDGE